MLAPGVASAAAWQEPTIVSNSSGGWTVVQGQESYDVSASTVQRVQEAIDDTAYKVAGEGCSASSYCTGESSAVADRVVELAHEDGKVYGDGPSVDAFNSGLWDLGEAESVLPSWSAIGDAAAGALAASPEVAGGVVAGVVIGAGIHAVLSLFNGSGSAESPGYSLERVSSTRLAEGVCLFEPYIPLGTPLSPTGGDAKLQAPCAPVSVPSDALLQWVSAKYSFVTGYGFGCSGAHIVNCPVPPGQRVSQGAEYWENFCCENGKEAEKLEVMQDSAVFVDGSQIRSGLAASGAPGTPQTSMPSHTVTVPLPEAPRTLPVAPTEVPTESEAGATVPPVVAPIVTTTVVHEVEQQEAEHGERDEKEVAADPLVPEAPEIPQPRPNEAATEFASELETDGWTSVELKTLPESAEDPSTGPGDAAYTSPSGHVDYATHVIVEVNPDTAPAPDEGAPLFKAPTASIHLPSFGVACKSFPFGVPCWVVKMFERWSAAGKAPVLTVPLGVGTITVDLAVVEPVLTVVRPLVIVAIIVGLVYTFTSFAISGTAGGGGGGDDE